MGELNLKVWPGLLSGLLFCVAPALAQEEMLAKESAARSADAKAAYTMIAKGDGAYEEGNYQVAVEQYAAALANLPAEAPVVSGLRAVAVQRFSQASLVQAQKLMRTGDSAGASALLNQVDAVDPNNPKVKQFRSEMMDPIRTNPALTPGHAAKVNRVRGLLDEAQGFYDLGQFDRAYLTYEDILRIDPHNVTAQRGMEKVNSAKSGYAQAARDQARSELLADVDSGWERRVDQDDQLPVVGGDPSLGGVGQRALIEQKLNTIMVPELRLSGATLNEAIDFLRVVSVREDKVDGGWTAI